MQSQECLKAAGERIRVRKRRQNDSNLSQHDSVMYPKKGGSLQMLEQAKKWLFSPDPPTMNFPDLFQTSDLILYYIHVCSLCENLSQQWDTNKTPPTERDLTITLLQQDTRESVIIYLNIKKRDISVINVEKKFPFSDAFEGK